MGKYQELRIANDFEVGLRYGKDVNYLTNEEKSDYIQMIYPDFDGETKKAYPVILYLLEDQSNTGDIYGKIPSLAKFAQRGYAVAMVKHQSQRDSFLTSVDLDATIQYLLENASKYHLDMKRLCVFSDTINGQIINQEQNLTVEKKELKDFGCNMETLIHNVKAVISLGGKENIEHLCRVTEANLPPILVVLEDENTYYQNLWSEHNLDFIEDFISNYI